MLFLSRTNHTMETAMNTKPSAWYHRLLCHFSNQIIKFKRSKQWVEIFSFDNRHQKMDCTLVLFLWSLIVCNECCVIIWWSINSLSQKLVWCVWFPGLTQPGLSKFPSLPQSCTWGWFRGCSSESVVITVQASPLCSALLSVCGWWSGIVTNIFQWPAEHMILETLIWSGLMCECWYEWGRSSVSWPWSEEHTCDWCCAGTWACD